MSVGASSLLGLYGPARRRPETAGRDRNIAATGRSGTGKTHRVLAETTGRWRVICDPSGTASSPHWAETRDIDSCLRWVASRSCGTLVLKLDQHDGVEAREAVEKLCEHLRQKLHRRPIRGLGGAEDRRDARITVVIDEYRDFFGGRDEMKSPISMALRKGRHFGVSICPIAQSPGAFPRDMGTNLDETWLFPAGNMGPDAADMKSSLGAKLAARVMALPRYHAIVYDAIEARYFEADAAGNRRHI